jgi:hypothetical protein
MEHEEDTNAKGKRRLRVRASGGDVFVTVLDVPEGEYECVLVNGSWIEKGLLEGDMVLCNASSEATDGDIVMIEEHGEIRLGVLSTLGYLATPVGQRPLEPSERIVGVGVALARRLSSTAADFKL